MVKVLLKQKFVESFLARKNKSQNWLAFKLGISSGYMSQLMNGTRCPSPKMREKLLKNFVDINFDDLFNIQDQ
jgi:hypothetical protein